MTLHRVAVLALPNFVSYDLGIACEVFRRVRLPNEEAAYRVMVCGQTRVIRSEPFDIHVEHGLETLTGADTIIVPGIDDPLAGVPGPVIAALRNAWDRGARMASICSGAFVLAQSGLLDGRRATTHWAGAKALAVHYPAVTVEPDVLFIDEGRIITSAGASAGLDMCLHLIGRDHGRGVAAQAARLAVAPLSRTGGQAQFIRYEPPTSRASLAPLIDWISHNLGEPLTVNVLAERACMSGRTFARRFREQIGITPLQYVLTMRVQRAQEWLAGTDMPVERIAALTGFDSPVTFRTRFRGMTGLTPSEYRQRFSLEVAVG